MQSIANCELELLRIILADPNTINIYDMPDDLFQDNSYCTIYGIIKELVHHGISPDSVMIYDGLLKAERSDLITMFAGITPSHENIKNAPYHVERLIEYKRKIEIKKSIMEAMELLDDASISALDLSDQTIEKISQAFRRTESRKSPEMKNLFPGYVDDIEERVRQKESGHMKVITTGFYELDNLMGPILPGELVIVAARPGGSKTSFATHVADHVAVNNFLPTVFFSLEMTQNQMIDRFMALKCAATVRQLRSGDLDSSKLAGIIDAINFYDNIPIYIYDGSTSASELHSRIRREVVAHGAKFIVIDYVGLISGLGSDGRGARWEKVGEESRELKRLALELKTAIMPLVQLGRQSQDVEPSIADLKDSASLESDADRVLLLYPKGEYHPGDRYKQIAVKVGKNRHGDTGEVNLQFDGPYTRFVEEQGVHEKSTWQDIGEK